MNQKKKGETMSNKERGEKNSHFNRKITSLILKQKI